MITRTTARYRENHKSFGEFIVSSQVRKPVVEIAGDIAEIVAAGSARSDDEDEDEDGHMADQWNVREDAGTIKVGRNVRVRVDIFNPNIAASAQEFGAGARRGQRTRLLGRTAAQFGDFYDHGEGS